jgi:guanine nucleotide-binding protein subunit alpha
MSEQRCAELILTDPDINPNEPLPVEYLHAFTSLWEDRGVQIAMLKGNEYALHDNLS